MYKKIILNILLIIGLFTVHFSFVSGLPSLLRNLNLILVILILILGMGNFKLAFFWAIGLGIFLDAYSFFSFNVFLISLVSTIILVNLLQANFFTDRSLYSFLALTFFSSVFYEICLYIFSFLDSFFSRQEFKIFWNSGFLKNELSKIFINLIAIFIFYYFISLISKNLQPVFLVRKKLK